MRSFAAGPHFCWKTRRIIHGLLCIVPLSYRHVSIRTSNHQILGPTKTTINLWPRLATTTARDDSDHRHQPHHDPKVHAFSLPVYGVCLPRRSRRRRRRLQERSSVAIGLLPARPTWARTHGPPSWDLPIGRGRPQ